jgi:amino acid transporter
VVITAMSALIVIISATAFHATAFDSFLWSGTIGTLILLVAYVLASIGCIMLVFVRRKLPVPAWQVVIPVAGLIVLGYTLYRNVIPYPTGDAAWFPVVSGAWLLVAIVAVIFAAGTARKLGVALAAREGIKAPGEEQVEASSPGLAPAGGEAS